MSFFTNRPTSGTFRNSPGLATFTAWYCFRSKCPGAVFTVTMNSAFAASAHSRKRLSGSCRMTLSSVSG